MKNYLKVFMINLTTLTLLALPMAVAKPTTAEVIGASSKPGVVRIYNPQEFTQTGTLTTADGSTTISLPAHNVRAYDVPAGTVRVAPDGDSPDFIVDHETVDFASPAIITDRSKTHMSGVGDGTLYLFSDGGTAVVTQFVDGKPVASVTTAVNGSASLGVIGEYSVDFTNGSGAAAFEGSDSEQRELLATRSLLSQTGLRWGKPTTVATKMSRTEMKYAVENGFANCVALDPGFAAKFGGADVIATVLNNWTDGDQSNGEFMEPAAKELNGTLYFLVTTGTETSGLNAKKLSGKQKITLSVPEAHSRVQGYLGLVVEQHPTMYWSNVNASTRPNAAWAKKKMNASFTAAAPLVASDGLIVPYVTADTSITLLNSSPWNTTYTVSTAVMGSDPRAGVQQNVTLAPGETKTLENLVAAESSAYIKTNGDQPAVAVTRPGLDIPVLPEAYANNTKKQAIVMQTGKEKFIVLSGNSTSTNTMTFEARGPEGGGYVSGQPLYFPPNTVWTGNVNVALNMVKTQDSSCDSIPKSEDESKLGVVYVYENPATLEQRMRKGQTVTTPTQVDQYSTEVKIIVKDGDQTLYSTATGVHDQTMKRWLNVSDISYMVGHVEWTCDYTPVQAEDLTDRFLNVLTRTEQDEVSANNTDDLKPYMDNSCDTTKTQHMYMYMFEVTPK